LLFCFVSNSRGALKKGLKSVGKKLKGFINKFAKRKKRDGVEHTKNASKRTKGKHQKANARRDKEQKKADEKEAGTKSTKDKRTNNQKKKDNPNYKKGPKKKDN